MHFKKLDLIGFKSFADKTTIHFEPGVTAVVGPNGCGKSNIADAVRWVLGEQSAKSLRGSSMEDVIFSGSAAKDAINLAEVSLTFSNEDKLLAIDYEEVTITRRLYRSGESEYLINKNPVRLKDIHELLMGTGIGTDSYSSIEQGKMDAILNSKPEDRRTIFEEAAGITKFKSKKKEALRKLEQTDANLLRVNDIIQEVKRQIGSIERQAKKAESYKIEFEKLKNFELSLASREFLIFEDGRKRKESELEALKAQEAEITVQVKALEDEYHRRRAKLDELENTVRVAEARESSLAADIRRCQDRVLLNRERVGELAERRENLLRQLEAGRKRVEEFRAELAGFESELELARREEAEGKAFLETVEAEFQSFEKAQRERDGSERMLTARLEQIAREESERQLKCARKQAERAALEARLQKVQERRGHLEAELSRAKEELERAVAESKAREEASQPVLWTKIRDLKGRLKEIFQNIMNSGRREFSSEEESRLENQIRSFADEVWTLQGFRTTDHGVRASIETRIRSTEEDLRFLDRERRELSDSIRIQAEEEANLGQPDGSAAAEESEIRRQLEELRAGRAKSSEQREALLMKLAETRSRQESSISRREKIERDRGWVHESLRNQEELLGSYEREMSESAAKKEALEAESVTLEEEGAKASQARDAMLGEIEGLRIRRREEAVAVETAEKEKEEKQAFLNDARQKAHSFEMESAQLRFEIDRLKERIYNAYQIDLAAAESASGAEEDLEALKAQIQSQKEKLARMGTVNLVAIEEYDEMKGRLDFLTQQSTDLIQAKDDLHKAIQKINRTTKELFTETFAKIQGYFSEYYKLLFGGGSAELVLLDENDVLESGIEIIARPPGKKLQTISLLSGGEKALTAIAVLFSLFKVRPSPFCVLDEIDAPLDETNVDRFCGVLRDFISGSQFILITHNKRTMNLADAMYGITMQQTGVSRVVSVKFPKDSKARQEVIQLHGANGNGASNGASHRDPETTAT